MGKGAAACQAIRLRTPTPNRLPSSTPRDRALVNMVRPHKNSPPVFVVSLGLCTVYLVGRCTPCWLQPRIRLTASLHPLPLEDSTQAASDLMPTRSLWRRQARARLLGTCFCWLDDACRRPLLLCRRRHRSATVTPTDAQRPRPQRCSHSRRKCHASTELGLTISDAKLEHVRSPHLTRLRQRHRPVAPRYCGRAMHRAATNTAKFAAKPGPRKHQHLIPAN